MRLSGRQDGCARGGPAEAEAGVRRGNGPRVRPGWAGRPISPRAAAGGPRARPGRTLGPTGRQDHTLVAVFRDVAKGGRLARLECKIDTLVAVFVKP